MAVVELEKTYLAKYLPINLGTFPSKEIIDLYLPADAQHALLRIRKSGDYIEITKKTMVGNDASHQIEQTIDLTAEEYGAFSFIVGKRLRKMRYYYPYQGINTEIDVFLDDLAGLVLVDVEFASADLKDTFTMPDFCLADVTQDEWLAGGVLSGKTYADIEEILKSYHYQKLVLS